MSYVSRWKGEVAYADSYKAMREFTLARDETTPDEVWYLQHPPVFTQGQAGKAEHILAPGNIPVVQTDRGGQVTYHGPGQLMVYLMLDLERLGYGIRSMVTKVEQAIAETLLEYGIDAAGRRDAPGVYVGERKIASLGLRVRKGRSYHGMALNVAMDLEPFSRINPCGFQGLQMTQVSELGGPSDPEQVGRDLEPRLASQLLLS